MRRAGTKPTGEVAEVFPALVAPDGEGKPYSVRYHVLPSLLLNELQNQQRTIHDQQQVIAALAARVEAVERSLSTAPEGSSR